MPIQPLDKTDSNYNRTLRYDKVDRLKSANGAWGQASFDYDLTGNLIRQRVGDRNINYQYQNQRLSMVKGSTQHPYPEIQYDLRGNITRGGRNEKPYLYDQASRLIEAEGGALHYLYDGHHHRVREQRVGGPTHYSVYNRASRLLHEQRGPEGEAVDYLYLGGQLVARVGGRADCKTDGDSDGIPDCIEQRLGLDPADPTDALLDPDGDDLNNLAEYQAHTDDDGMPDGWEVQYRLNPLSSDDADDDPDTDGRINVDEYRAGTDPHVADTSVPPDPDPDPDPAHPNGLTAASGNAENLIAWSDAGGTRTLYWATTPEVSLTTATLIANLHSPYRHTGLSNGTRYYYRVTDAQDLSALSEEVSAQPGERVWSVPEILATTPNGTLAIDERGQAIFAREANSNIEVRRYQSQTGWQAPIVPLGGLQEVDSLQIGLDGPGDGLLVWRSQQETLLAAAHRSAGQWSLASDISETLLLKKGHRIALNAQGQGVIFWLQGPSPDDPYYAYARKYDTSGQIGAIVLLDTQVQYQDGSSNLQVAINNTSDSFESPRIKPCNALRVNAQPLLQLRSVVEL
jgi:hypothetical protein